MQGIWHQESKFVTTERNNSSVRERFGRAIYRLAVHFGAISRSAINDRVSLRTEFNNSVGAGDRKVNNTDIVFFPAADRISIGWTGIILVRFFTKKKDRLLDRYSFEE